MKKNIFYKISLAFLFIVFILIYTLIFIKMKNIKSDSFDIAYISTHLEVYENKKTIFSKKQDNIKLQLNDKIINICIEDICVNSKYSKIDNGYIIEKNNILDFYGNAKIENDELIVEMPIDDTIFTYYFQKVNE